MNKKTVTAFAKLALLIATIIWGSSFFIMKNTLDSIGSFYLLAIRFSVASVLLGIIFMPRFKKTDKGYLRGGAVMGVLLGLAYAVQTIGLKFTTPGKNAFLTASYCLMVPFLYWAVAKRKPDKYNIFAAVVCIAGIGFVSLGSGEGGVNIGDLLTLASGFFYACHIIAVNKAAEGRDIILLTVIQFITSAVMFWLCGALTESFPHEIQKEMVVSLAYLGVMCTAAALLLQNIGQKFTPPSQASLILSLEAVFGVAFSVAFADEHLTPQLIFGFGLIFVALVVSEVKPDLKKYLKFLK